MIISSVPRACVVFRSGDLLSASERAAGVTPASTAEIGDAIVAELQ